MNRRDFITLGSSTLLPTGAATPAPQTSLAPPRQPTPGRPNILLLMADQFRADCIGASGNRIIHTPHLDRLAREGVLFRNAYSSTPTCIPARTALLTGLSPWSHGLLGYAPMATRPYAVEKASALASAGYYTTAIGKNHYNPITHPHGYHHLLTDEHCDYWFHKDPPTHAQSPEPRCDYESWFWSQRPDTDPHLTGLGWNDQPAKPFALPEELHATHFTGATAVRFLEQYDRPDPFFLKVSFIRPHSPYDPPERFFKMYEDADIPAAEVGAWASRYEPRNTQRDDLWHGKLPAEDIRRTRIGYYGSVSFVDEQIGHILSALEQRNLLEDTLIVFVSDHGDMLGDQNMWRKSYAYEQSAHIPLLLRPPASLNLPLSTHTVDQVVELRDLLPTFLDAASAPIPPSIEGRSLLHLLRTRGEGWRDFLDLEHNICFGPENHWTALTDGRWKYIFHAFTGEEQLFQLTADPHELNDLAKSPPHAADLQLWHNRMVAHLTPRGEQWVANNQLQLRKQSMMYSPNFPGYAT